MFEFAVSTNEIKVTTDQSEARKQPTLSPLLRFQTRSIGDHSANSCREIKFGFVSNWNGKKFNLSTSSFSIQGTRTMYNTCGQPLGQSHGGSGHWSAQFSSSCSPSLQHDSNSEGKSDSSGQVRSSPFSPGFSWIFDRRRDVQHSPSFSSSHSFCLHWWGTLCKSLVSQL